MAGKVSESAHFEAVLLTIEEQLDCDERGSRLTANVKMIRKHDKHLRDGIALGAISKQRHSHSKHKRPCHRTETHTSRNQKKKVQKTLIELSLKLYLKISNVRNGKNTSLFVKVWSVKSTVFRCYAFDGRPSN